MMAEQRGGLRVVASDNCTLVDFGSLQGTWTEAQYLKLTSDSSHSIEFTDGLLEILPMRTDRHQTILKFLFRALLFVEDTGGTVLFAPLRLRIRQGKFREPDLLLVRDANDARRGNDYWSGADLIMEVVSPDNPDRDIREKRSDYAEAGITEYWIVNPMDETVTLLFLVGHAYDER